MRLTELFRMFPCYECMCFVPLHDSYTYSDSTAEKIFKLWTLGHRPQQMKLAPTVMVYYYSSILTTVPESLPDCPIRVGFGDISFSLEVTGEM
jgi:hypothetical protein